MNVQKIIFCGNKAIQPGQKINVFGIKEITGTRSSILQNNKKTFHVTSQVKYPLAKNLPLPNNIEAIMSIEIGQFSPQRARDITGPMIISKSENVFKSSRPVFSKTFNQFLESYDCKGAVSLNSSMQSNVPIPFKSKGNVMHLNMPGGQWEQGNKFISEDMQKKMFYPRIIKKKQGIQMFHTLSYRNTNSSSSIMLRRLESTQKIISKKDLLKKAVKEYGSTVIVFHVGISLISLGIFYFLVASGLSMEAVIYYLPWLDSPSSSFSKTTGTFVTAYAIHKLFAPVRIGITLTSVPFIVRYLRKVGFLKSR